MAQQLSFSGRSRLLTALALGAVAALSMGADGDACNPGPPTETVCVLGGTEYAVGAPVPADDCNSCTCTSDGTIACTAMGCPQACTYGGQTYERGQSFPADDGCNTCFCDADGAVACTEMACVTPCDYAGKSWLPGDTFPADDGCNTCTCLDSGQVACTKIACPVTGCTVGGVEYAVGTSFLDTDGCNTCTCLADGGVACTDMACVTPVCTYDGLGYQAGDHFPSIDGCTTCICREDGAVQCAETLVPCVPARCEHGGHTYDIGERFDAGPGGCKECVCLEGGEVHCSKKPCPMPGCDVDGQHIGVGASFPAGDGCNTCTCMEDGGVACTKMACQCDQKTEWWRHYVGTSPEMCMLIKFACVANTSYFANACGCGCEQSADCPQVLTCDDSAGCDLEALKAQCPLSEVDATVPSGGCTAEVPCNDAWSMCWAPGQKLPCGACFTPDPSEVCSQDAECGEDQICAPDQTSCSCTGEWTCVAACTSSKDCKTGEQCGLDGHCAPTACAASADCPTNFDCLAGQCNRRQCKASAACSGQCVNGQCYEAAGYCSPPPP